MEEVLKYVILFPPPKGTYFCKVEFIKNVSVSIGSRLNFFKQMDMSWTDTIGCVHARKHEHGRESLWRRTGARNSTTDIMYFVLTIPIGQEHTLKDEVEKRVKLFFHVVTKKKNDFIGKLCLEHVRDLKGDMGALAQRMLSEGRVNWDQAAHHMTNVIYNHWKDGPSFQYDGSLDKYMVDYDIKSF